jgi:hypothetical protein
LDYPAVEEIIDGQAAEAAHESLEIAKEALFNLLSRLSARLSSLLFSI